MGLGLRLTDEDDIGEDTAEELLDWIGHLFDSDLTRWEIEFVGDLEQRLENYGGRTRISPAQWDVINRIKEKLG